IKKNNYYNEGIAQIIRVTLERDKISAFLFLMKSRLKKHRDIHSRKDLHEFRKLLKRYYYILKVIDKQSGNKDKRRALKIINHLQKSIGRWHDSSIVKNLMNSKKTRLLKTIKKNDLQK